MPIVLVVDDSQVDQRRVGGLLSRDLDWLIEYASDGEQAISHIKVSVPDVVITDMMMPKVDGMGLVNFMQVEYPQVPVILITAHGSEELAVDALAGGATSYVPKDQIGDKLRETVEQVLALARADRSYARLIDCLQRTEYKLALFNDPTLIPPLVDLVQQMLAGMRCCNETGRMHAGIALEEALLNAMLHGNLQMSKTDIQEARTKLRQGERSQLVELRRIEAPFARRQVHVEINVSAEQATFIVRDEGDGFDTTSVPEAHDPATVAGEKGRGLVLMKNFMDDLRFSDSGNEVHMTMQCTGTRCTERITPHP